MLTLTLMPALTRTLTLTLMLTLTLTHTLTLALTLTLTLTLRELEGRSDGILTGSAHACKAGSRAWSLGMWAEGGGSGLRGMGSIWANAREL